MFGGDNGGEGLYYIKRVDNNTISFAKVISKHILFQICSRGPQTVKNNIIEPFEINGKLLEPQKIYREISTPIETYSPEATVSGPTGILVNGVEILNYKSDDLLYYGNIENVEVTAPGDGFDIVNPPKMLIEDAVGTGATGCLAVNGSLRQINIIDRGFDYIENPTISITGGNGDNAKAIATLKLIDHERRIFLRSTIAKSWIRCNFIYNWIFYIP